MLDFYLLKDHLPKTRSLSSNEHVGMIEYEEFEYLQELGIIEKHLDYYQDFRCGLEDVERKLRKIGEVVKDKNESGLGINKFQDILTMALNNNSGLFAISD